jgi:hypothetical protein
VVNKFAHERMDIILGVVFLDYLLDKMEHQAGITELDYDTMN